MNLQEMLTQPPAGGLAGRGTSKGAGVAESDGKFAAAFDSEQAPTNNSAIQDEATPQSSPDDGGEAPPDKGANAVLEIDLENQQIGRPNGEKISFDVDAFRKHCLLNGLDDIGLTMEKGTMIDSFEEKRKEDRPWLVAS